MREVFEKWWEANGTQSTVHKEDFWEAFQFAWESGEAHAEQLAEEDGPL